jgi:hypothetical protein
MSIASEAERAPTDQAGTQQGSGGDRVVKSIKRESVSRIGDYMCCKTAITSIARENWVIAKILPST